MLSISIDQTKVKRKKSTHGCKPLFFPASHEQYSVESYYSEQLSIPHQLILNQRHFDEVPDAIILYFILDHFVNVL